MDKKQKKIAIAVVVIVTVLFLLWLRGKGAVKHAADNAIDAQDSYYQTYNNPPIVKNTSPSGGYDFGDTIISTTNAGPVYGATASDLDRLADKICGCVKNKCAKSSNILDTNMLGYDALLPDMPGYLQNYVIH